MKPLPKYARSDDIKYLLTDTIDTGYYLTDMDPLDMVNELSKPPKNVVFNIDQSVEAYSFDNGLIAYVGLHRQPNIFMYLPTFKAYWVLFLLSK